MDKAQKPGIPLGLSMALAQDQDAFTRFASMNEMQKQQVIQQARTVSSKKEMSALVRNIGNYMT